MGIFLKSEFFSTFWSYSTLKNWEKSIQQNFIVYLLSTTSCVSYFEVHCLSLKLLSAMKISKAGAANSKSLGHLGEIKVGVQHHMKWLETIKGDKP